MNNKVEKKSLKEVIETTGSSGLDLDKFPSEEEIKEHVKEMSPEEILRQWHDDPKNKEMLRRLATEIETIFRGNWFGLNKMSKKIKRFKTRDEQINVLNTLKLQGLLEARMFGKPGHIEERYKIVLSSEQRVEGLMDVIKDYQEVINYYSDEVKKIEEQIVKLKST